MSQSLVLAYQRSYLGNRHAAQMMHEDNMAVQLSAQICGCVPSSACLCTSKSSIIPVLQWLQKQLYTLTQAREIAHSADGMQTQATLQSVHSAFLMGPKERAVYLRRPLPKGRHAAEQSGEEEAGTVAGTNAAALRAWLRQVSNHVHNQCTCVATFSVFILLFIMPTHRVFVQTCRTQQCCSTAGLHHYCFMFN